MQKEIFLSSIRRFNRFYTEHLGLLNQHILESNYSLAEVRVLYELAHQPECTAAQLQTVLQMDAGYLSRILKTFRKDDLVERQASAEDARRQLIRLTPQGRQLLNSLNGKSDAQIEAITRHLSFSGQEDLLIAMHSVWQLLAGKADKKQLAQEVTIRTELRPGDIGQVIYLHGFLHQQENQYDIAFESYVAAGLHEFYGQYNPATNRVWVCEHYGRMVGFLLLMNRGTAAQLRYFILRPEYRGIGLGKRLMDLYMAFLKECGYQSSYLWTTHELHTAAYLYRSYGFRLTEEKESTAFGKPLREQRYDLQLC